MTRTPVADWQQLSALYEQADALDAGALRAWLDELRQQGHPLLVQLEGMLSARDEVDGQGFLQTLPRLTPPTPEPHLHLWEQGLRIGPYRLLQQIGRGGMAEVWLAERDDGAFQRQVAMKLLFRHADSTAADTIAQRFARERDILASLRHPNIAGLHDAGVTVTGQPWIAIEYVEGSSLGAWCDSRRLDLRARMSLFRQVLLAVRHAHSNLIIHRDLKPANILVTTLGEVRLLDFGIAKLMEAQDVAQDATELTRLAGRPLTLQYASPEQIRDEPLTTATDVYSLGVVLYELLCGLSPYELKVASAAQIEQAIIEQEPRAPSRREISAEAAAARGSEPRRLARELASDLDAIVLKALAKRPARRYASVDALTADLDHWMAGEAVQARTPSLAYRLGKFTHRHALGVGLGVAAACTLVLVTAVAVVMGLQAREESARAVASRDFMLGIFQRANQEKSRGADITARDMLETGRQDVLTRLTGQPRLQAELLRGIAKIQADMGEYRAADITFDQLTGIYTQLGEPREAVLTRIDRGSNAIAMNRPDIGREMLAGVQARPADAEIRAGRARLAGQLALLTGDANAARALLIPGRMDALAALGEANMRTFKLGQVLARAERDSGRSVQALQLQDELRRTAARVPGLGADEVANMDFQQASLLASMGRFREALRVSDEALLPCVGSLGPRAQECRYLEVKRAQMQLRLGFLDRARDAAEQLEAIAADTNLPYLQIEALLTLLRLQAGDARDHDLQLVRAYATSGPVQPSLRAGAMLGLAESGLRRGQWAQARDWTLQALALLNATLDGPVTSRTAANARMLLGIASLGEGRTEEALRHLQAAHDFLATLLGADHPVVQTVRLNRALALALQGRLADAVELASQARLVLRDAMGHDAPAYLGISSWVEGLARSAAPLQVSQAFFVN